MALQVWLPLTKDLRNQGINGTNIEAVTSAVFDNNGKLGKCLSEGKIKIPANKVASIFNNTAMSIAFWYNNNTSETTGNHAICGFSGNGEGDSDAVRIWDFFNYNTPNHFHWSMGNLGGGSLTNVFPANTWVHVCVTWNAPTLKIYIDGVLKHTGSGSSNYTFDKSYYISFGRTPQKLNDFRIYDNCLTPEEVKRIAQGLVLHYPLNRNGWGQENLAIGSNTNSLSSNAWYHSNAVGGTSREIVVDNGIPCVKITRDSTAQSSWHYFSYQNLDRAKLKTNTYYTVSFDIKPSAAGSISWAGFLNGNGTTPLCSTNTVIQGDMVANQWNHIILRTLTNSSLTLESQCVYMYLPASLKAANTWVIMKNMHVEEGTEETPWCPHTNDVLYTTMGLNSTTEYDCSGFCNNGTRTGTFSWTSDTPKYCVSTTINSSKIQCITNPITGDDPIFSIGFWFKLKSNVSYITYADLVSFSSSSYSNQPFRLEICGSPVGSAIDWFRGPTGSTGGFQVNTSALSRDTWYHTVLVSEGNKQYSYYLNGVKQGTYNGSSNSWTPTNTFMVGDGQAGAFDISDVRIYATALSATDVKSLYQNCATIGPDGTIYGKIRN